MFLTVTRTNNAARTYYDTEPLFKETGKENYKPRSSVTLFSPMERNDFQNLQHVFTTILTIVIL